MDNRSFEVVATGPLTTVQDLGRPGFAALGVGRSGAADRGSLLLANRLLGNRESSAALEVTFGGLAVRCTGGANVALTGAPCPMHVDGREVSPYAVAFVPDGAELRLGLPTSGLRSYLAVQGGVDVRPALGSRSTDTMSGLGPDPLAVGQHLRIGIPRGRVPGVDVARVRVPEAGDIVLRVVPGPRADWFTPAAYDALLSSPYDVTSDSNRVGMRLSGPVLERATEGEIPSEGMVPGALQVPPSGQPTLFLADHPVTGGYPVIGVVLGADLGLAAQARPGQSIRFRRA